MDLHNILKTLGSVHRALDLFCTDQCICELTIRGFHFHVYTLNSVENGQSTADTQKVFCKTVGFNLFIELCAGSLVLVKGDHSFL